VITNYSKEKQKGRGKKKLSNNTKGMIFGRLRKKKKSNDTYKRRQSLAKLG
jgi:hypothetical protein